MAKPAAEGSQRRPGRAQREFERRGQLVRVKVELEVGSLEQLRLLLAHRHGEQSLDQVVQEAVRWLLAREARSIVQLQAIEARRAEAARREAEAIALSRQERDAIDRTNVVERALAAVREASASGDRASLDS